MTPEIGEALHEIVMDLLARSAFADDERLTGKLCETDLFGLGAWVVGWQHNINSFGPEALAVTARPFGGASDEGDIKVSVRPGPFLV